MSSIIPPLPAGAPYRLLVLDRDTEDPKWLLCAVSLVSDVRPATLDASGRYTDWGATCRWVRAQTGRRNVALIPLADPLCWRVDEAPIRPLA